MNEFIDGTYVDAAGIRNYKLYVAASRPAEVPPLFVMLHGCDQDAADFSIGTRMNELAEECRGVVLYPEQCRLVNPLGCWNWHDANHQFADHGEPSLIAGMTRQVMAEHNIDPPRVYVAGMSAGGAMAVIVGQEYPDLYAAVGVHSGVPSGVASDLLSALRAMTRGPAVAELAPASASKRNRSLVSHPQRGHSRRAAIGRKATFRRCDCGRSLSRQKHCSSMDSRDALRELVYDVVEMNHVPLFISMRDLLAE